MSNGHSAMRGKRYLLDTNALVALLQGHVGVLTMSQEAEWLGVSVINVLEFLGFHGLSASDRTLFLELVSRIEVIDLSFADQTLIEFIIKLRQGRAIKLPDAIILASAASQNAVLVTQDARLLSLAAEYPMFSAHPF